MTERERALLERLTELEKQVSTLKAHTRVDTFLNQLNGDGGISALIQAASTLTRKSVVLFDHHERTVAAAAPEFPTPVTMPALRDIVAACAPVDTRQHSPILVRAGRGSGLARRKLLTSVEAAGENFGWLVLDEHPTPMTGLDRYVARRVSDRLGAEFLAQRRIARVVWDARTSLARQMLRGSLDYEGLGASGEYLGVDIWARRVVVFVAAEGLSAADAIEDALARDLGDELEAEVLSVRGPEGVVLLVALPPGMTGQQNEEAYLGRVRSGIDHVTRRVLGIDIACVGLSRLADSRSLPRAYREAREAALAVAHMPLVRSRIAQVEDLGPARLFLAHASESSLRGFVDDVLGSLLHKGAASAVLLATLQTYVDSSRSVRETARILGVHENTVRLRLGRIHDFTGLDIVGNAKDQLSVQIALMLHSLQTNGASAVQGTGDSRTIDRDDVNMNVDVRRGSA